MKSYHMNTLIDIHTTHCMWLKNAVAFTKNRTVWTSLQSPLEINFICWTYFGIPQVSRFSKHCQLCTLTEKKPWFIVDVLKVKSWSYFSRLFFHSIQESLKGTSAIKAFEDLLSYEYSSMSGMIDFSTGSHFMLEELSNRHMSADLKSQFKSATPKSWRNITGL